MTRLRLLIILSFAGLLVGSARLPAQGVPAELVVQIAAGDSLILLPHEFLVGTVTVAIAPATTSQISNPDNGYRFPPSDSLQPDSLNLVIDGGGNTTSEDLRREDTLRTDSTRIPEPSSDSLDRTNDSLESPSPGLPDTGEQILSQSDYTVDARYGSIMIGPGLQQQLIISGDTLRLRISYRYLPLDLPREYYLRELVMLDDSTNGGTRVIRSAGDTSRTSGLSATGIFGKDFERSGSISRGIAVGSNRDLSVESSLRLQFRGKITDDVEVLGALTDEQTPIQPEGNTQTLREIDNIFFEVRSPIADATLGKFYATGAGGEFTGFTRKLQGVKGLGKFGDVGSTQIVAAVSPGKFRTQEFQGREGDQGPYRLTGPSGERDIIVLAGTERVFVDGIEMIRGRENDYVIDYGTGEIFFQPRRPITSANEIVVDFEYSDRRYARSFLSAAHTVRFLDSAMRVTASVVREADDQDNPVDLILTDRDRLLLASAAGDASTAFRSGVRFIGRSDTASGSYRRVDTTINGLSDSIFVYDPSNPASVYDVTFSPAADGRGDYRSVAFGQYDFVGKGAGAYLPVIYLPLPGLQQVGAVVAEGRLSPGVVLGTEVAFSGTDRNRFSSDPAVQRNGVALKGELTGVVDTLRAGGLNLGRVSTRANVRYLESDFQPINRISEPEFDRIWNTATRLGNSGFNDLIAEGRLDWRPKPIVEFGTGFGELVRGDFFSSFRQEYGFRFGNRSFPFAADYVVNIINSDDTLNGGLESDWFKGRGGVSYRIGGVIPGFRIDHQVRDDRRSVVDTLVQGAFRFVEAGPELTFEYPLLRTFASARYRVDDSARFDPVAGETRFVQDGTAQTLSVGGELRGVRNLNSTVNFTYRRKTYDSIPGVDPTSRLENVSILARSDTRWSPFNRGIALDGVYEVQTEQAARLQRVFVQVPIGQGGYIWQDLDSNGIQTENEFRETIAGDGQYVRISLPTEQLFPVVNLRANIRFRFEPERVFAEDSDLGTFLKPLTTETYVRVEEKSSSENESDIYLLNFGAFQDDSTTLDGLGLIQQDINLFERSREFNLRLRYIGRSGMTRLYNDLERSRSIERSLRMEWNPTDDIGLRFDGGIDDRSLLGSALTAARAFDLQALRGETDFSYRPERSLELGYIFRIRSADDQFPAQPRSTFLTTNEVRSIYSIETKGRLTATLERTVVTGRNLEGNDLFSLPFQLTDGYAIGTTWAGRLSFDYRIGANIQATLTYTGRAEPPTNRVIHTGRAEVRAFF